MNYCRRVFDTKLHFAASIIQGESDLITWLNIKTPLWKRHSINLQKISQGECQIYKNKNCHYRVLLGNHTYMGTFCLNDEMEEDHTLDNFLVHRHEWNLCMLVVTLKTTNHGSIRQHGSCSCDIISFYIW